MIEKVYTVGLVGLFCGKIYDENLSRMKKKTISW